ncbi:putative phospholipase B-like lamina ancestor [Phlebotomus argentipes]|uniref:putative phospholipase B-like lamina ancestor n=1 Tax=Phlebotomus argentipes TaxID=94469 RepID=UPI002893735C|nr:putative phospholipase B-like lamina ancestor [Phlebotomus argentipes]
MLKVVGASWYKTKIGSLIVLAAIILGLGALFIIDMERPTFDGTFCATVYWTKMSGYRVEFWGQQNDLDSIPLGVARICYKDTIFENGWSQIEIETNPVYSDRIQATGAGILEGALTWKSIYYQWTNMINAQCLKDDDSMAFCAWARKILLKNYESVRKQAELNADHDHYWYQIQLFYYQLEGLEFGWRKGIKRSALKRSRLEIPPEDFLLMNAGGDLRDLRIYYDRVMMGRSSDANKDVRSSMLLNISEENGIIKLLVGHSAAKSYSLMLRIVKKYKFNFHFSRDAKSHVVPGSNIIFSGYPGVLSSTDDFYKISGRHGHLIVAGVGIVNKNPALWHQLDLRKNVILSARAMAANRLAYNGRSWSRVMAKDPGTGAKQWLVSDRKILRHLITTRKAAEFAEKSPVPRVETQTVKMSTYQPFEEGSQEGVQIRPDVETRGLVWLVDQLPGRLYAEDVTETLYQQGTIFCNGTPYFNATIELSLVEQENEKPIPRNFTDLDDVGLFLRQRANRGDLSEENPKAYGNIDLKLYAETNSGDMEFHAISGPISLPIKEYTFNAFTVSSDDPKTLNLVKHAEPFRWSDSNLPEKHAGHPDAWNFDKMSPKWAWK